MKKYLLSLLIVPLLLIGGYSSALTINDISENGGYSLSKVYINDGTTFTQGDILSYNCDWYNRYTCDLNFNGNGVYFHIKYFKSSDGGRWEIYNAENIPGGYYNISCGGNNRCFASIDIDKLFKSSPLVPGGTANFTPVITGLTGSINEFIPYVVYIGLGVLGVLIGFVAIKRLINWVRAKIFSSFK